MRRGGRCRTLRPMQNAPPISTVWRPYAEAARALGVRLTTEALEPGRSPKRLDELARRLHAELDQMMQRAFARLPEAGHLAAPPAATTAAGRCR